ncbi:restriction endonuclease subunit S [Mesorhizobium sp. B2-7-1]|uniref:restriction endonuclease subunit S n=1 Tax=Mesorhizobium sp. B2-7-1 TaxID=2589909 RepID=UPI00112A01AE|nr:restriction endonuclease subunit S [Mesorhizobium sp. B2-7-1]TPJ73039.1 restriction endonuclease subunit S [Mesorhizobium sp. B2-7-1]
MKPNIQYPAGWNSKRLKYAASYNDEVLPESTDDLTEIDYVEISGVSLAGGVEEVNRLAFFEAPSRARRKVRSGDILISTVRTYLRAIAAVDVASDGLIASTGFCVVRPLDGIDSAFLGWVAKSEPFVSEVVARSVGVSYPAINASDLVTIEVPLPPIDTQRQIARFLDEKTKRIDALIERKRLLLDRLSEKRQAVITHAVTKGLNPAALMKPSGIDWVGDIPVHWEVLPLKRVLSSSTYGISASLEPAGEVAVLRMGNLVDGEIDLGDLRFLDEVDESLLLEAGDVVFNRTNSLDLVGKASIFRGNADFPVSLASYLVRFRFSDKYLPQYANFVMGTEGLLAFARTLALPSIGQANLNPSRYAQIEFPIPPIAEQSGIVDYLMEQTSRFAAVWDRIDGSLQQLADYRASLVTAAVTGALAELR